MSSLVHAKCVSSATCARPSSSRRSRTKYSTAFTSCRVTASTRASASICSWPKPATTPRSAAFCASVNGEEERSDRSVRWMSHSISTWMRARLRPASERCSPSSVTTGA